MNDELIRKYFAVHLVNPEAYCGPTMEIAISPNEPSDSIWLNPHFVFHRPERA